MMIATKFLDIVLYFAWFMVNMLMLYVFSTFGTKEYDENLISQSLKKAFKDKKHNDAIGREYASQISQESRQTQ